MKAIYIFRAFSLFILLVLVSFQVRATHIRAGEIAVVRTSSNNNIYRITLTVYRDTDGIDFRLGTLDFGDGESIENFTDEGDPTNPNDDFLLEDQREIVGEKLEKIVFETLHEYISTSGTFKVSFKEENRNEGILNIVSSVNTPFYIESEFRIDNLTGQNSSPILTIPPVDRGVEGALYIHNPGAFDQDNDSLSFELITPLQDRNENISITVAGYRQPNESEFYENFEMGNSDRNGRPTFSMDPISGNLIWDAPGEQGEYNIAFRVTEFRKVGGVFQEIGYVVRDMQITIEESDNNPPEIEPIGPLCIDAGDIGRNFAVATDPDNDSILMEAFGEPFNVDFEAVFFPGGDIFQPTPGRARLDFEWQTNCIHAREEEYEVLVKAQDNGAPPLVDLESFTVQVAATAPTGVTAGLLDALSTVVNWDEYTCKSNHDMQVWRREGEFEFTPDDCETGIPSGGDYQMVGLIEDGNTQFIDNTISAGKTYCYRLVADYRGGLGAGLSYASDEVCVETDLVQPLLLNVDIQKDANGNDNGEIFLKWHSPLDLDTTIFERPFTYLVYDSRNRNEPLFTPPSQDTTFTVNGLDLEVERPSYFVEAYDPTGTVLYATSEQASTVKLEIGQVGQDSRLTFNAQVPWSINNNTHLIFRNRIDPDNEDLLVLIDSTNSLSFIDSLPQEKETEYCYYVTTRGAYDNERIASPLINKSQTACAFISDAVNSCIPDLLPLPDCKTQLASMPCDIDEYATTLNWTVPDDEGVCLDIREFVVLFSPNCDEVYDTLRPDDPKATAFEYVGTDGLQGCYRVASINFLGIEGLSNLEEKDSRGCQQIKFPNTFTPNGDNFNDIYNPFNDIDYNQISFADCPRFVKSINFNVYDRTGNQLFSFDSKVGQPFLEQKDLLMNWEGKNRDGNELPTGVYFYGADVLFYDFGREDISEKKEGWIKLRR